MTQQLRRGNGEGAIVQRKDGSWMFSLRIGKGQPRKCIYAWTRPELFRKITDARAAGRGTIRPTVKNTVDEWVESWLDHDKRPNLSRSTVAVYDVAWKKHAKPLVQGRRLDQFTSDDVRRIYATFRTKKVGGRTVQVVAKVMRGAFDAAIHGDKYHRANPWRVVPVPRHDYKEPHVLTEDESQRLVAAARDCQFEAVWLLSLFGGLRLGESLGLKWQDIDFRTGRVDVRQQLTEVNGELAIGALKTKSSRREIIVGPLVIGALLRRRTAAHQEGHGSPFIFTDAQGRFLNRTFIRRRHFEKVAKVAGITDVHPHDLRHTMSSHALAAGLSPVVVARRLGHGSTRMTLDRYGHQLPGAQAEAAAVIEGRFANINREKVVKMVVNRTPKTKTAPQSGAKTLIA